MPDSNGGEERADADRSDDRASDRSGWRHHLFDSGSFVPALLLAVLVIVLSPVLDAWRYGFVIVFPLSAALVLLVFQRSVASPRLMRIAVVLTIAVGVLVLVISVARAFGLGNDDYLVGARSLLFAALIAIAFPTVVRQAFTHRRIDLNTLAAGITAYLLIGIFFASMYRSIAAFHHYEIFAHIDRPQAGDYTYFSFITLTTVGYGDLVPGIDLARSLAIAEAIMGQIFLVTAVARIMSLYGTERPASRRNTARHDFDADAS